MFCIFEHVAVFSSEDIFMPAKPRPRVKGHPAVYGPRFSRRNAKAVSFVQQPIDLSIVEVLSLFRLLPAALITRLLEYNRLSALPQV